MRTLEVDAGMSGTLSFKDPVHLQINGRFDGALDIKGTLIVHEGAVLHGTCEMVSAVPSGASCMSVEELARYLEVDSGTIVEWAASGRLPGQPDGAGWRFDRKRIEDWLTQEKIR